MPEIPYKPVPSVTPVERKTPGISVAFPRAEFTQSIGSALESLGHSRTVLGSQVTQVGAALASLGGSFEKAGDQIWARAAALKQVENETAAIDADTKYMMASAQQYADFESKTGEAASGGLEAHMKSLEDTRQKIMGSLPNDEARKMFNERSLGTLGRTIFSSARHAHAQGKAAAIGAISSNIEMAITDLYNHPDAPDIEKKKDDLAKLQAKLDAMEGVKGGPQAQVRTQHLQSRIWSSQITGLARQGKINEAEKMFAEAQEKNQITIPDSERVQNSLRENYTDQSIRVETDKIMGDMREKKTFEEMEKEPNLRDRLDQGRKVVEDNPKLRADPHAMEKMELAIKSEFAIGEKVRADEQKRWKATVNSALAGDRSPKGELPKTREELFALGPDVEAAYRALDPARRIKVDRILAKTAEGDFADTEANRQKYIYLLGLASSSKTHAQFLDTDIAEQEIPWKYRRELHKLQQGLERKAEEDPRVDHMLSVMADKGIIPKDIEKRNVDDWTHLRGAAWKAIKETQEYLKRPLKDEDYVNIGKIIAATNPGTSRSIFPWARDYYQFEVPPDVMSKMKERQPTWDEDKIRDEVIYELMLRDLKKFYPSGPRKIPQLETPTEPEVEREIR